MIGHPDVLRALEVGQTNPEQGLSILDDLLAKEPWISASGAYNAYGQLCMKLGDLATARDAFERDIRERGGDHRFDWAYLALIIGLQDDIPQARQCAAKAGTIKIEEGFAQKVLEAHNQWLREHGPTPTRLAQAARSGRKRSRWLLWSPAPVVLGSIVTAVGYMNVRAVGVTADPLILEVGKAQARMPLIAGLVAGMTMFVIGLIQELAQSREARQRRTAPARPRPMRARKGADPKGVTCESCRKTIDKQPMHGTNMQLYNGVVCQSCLSVECTECKQAKGRIDAACSFCGSAVSPAFEHLIGK